MGWTGMAWYTLACYKTWYAVAWRGTRYNRVCGLHEATSCMPGRGIECALCVRCGWRGQGRRRRAGKRAGVGWVLGLGGWSLLSAYPLVTFRLLWLCLFWSLVFFFWSISMLVILCVCWCTAVIDGISTNLEKSAITPY